MNHECPTPRSRMEALELMALQQLRISELDAELKPLRERISQLDKQKAGVAAAVQRLKHSLATMRKGVTVSDHAVVRYLERRYGFDFESVRAEIATPALRAAAEAGASGWKVDGGTFRIQNGTVVTYVENGSMTAKTSRRKSC